MLAERILLRIWYIHVEQSGMMQADNAHGDAA